MNVLKSVAICTLLALSLGAEAGSYRCAGGAKLSADQRRCSDGSIPMYEADLIQPVAPASTVREERGGANAQNGRHEQRQLQKSADPTFFFRGWALYVPGGAYQVPIGLTDYNRIVVAPGTGIVHKLDIRPNRTFRWDQARGRWHPDQNGNVVLEKAYEGKDWTVTRNDRDGGIYVMDGFTWFQAKE